MRDAQCRNPKWYLAFSIAGEPGALKGARRVRREAAQKRLASARDTGPRCAVHPTRQAPLPGDTDGPQGVEPGDQFLAGGGRDCWAVVEDRFFLSFQRDATEPGDQWFPACPVDDGLEARALPVGGIDFGLVGAIEEGFDFLSFTIRRFHVRNGPKVLTIPSRDALKKIRQRNAQELRILRGAAPAEVIGTMNPIIRGQANYYRPGASKRAYKAPDLRNLSEGRS